ncbi:hypothetical protein PQQ84_05765 [Paraburkholderia strydomiana]|uniref:hypothetical protein n=1 Tax=Paraburkholderia strydomiana TaxID=1245417 RepID=UPI0038BDE0C7
MSKASEIAKSLRLVGLTEVDEAADLIEQQAARIAELEAQIAAVAPAVDAQPVAAHEALTDDVLMQAIADTAARGHVWASRALSNFRAAVREAAKSPDDA